MCKTTGEHKLLLLRLAVLKAEYSSPRAKMHGREPKYILQGGLAAVAKKRVHEAIEAERVLSTARVAVADLGQTAHGMSENFRTKILGRLDVSVVRVLFNKDNNVTSILAAVAWFYEDFVQAAEIELPILGRSIFLPRPPPP